MNCPVCREQFTIPDNGLSRIKKDFRMEKWPNAKKLSIRKAMCEQHKEEKIRMFYRECKVLIRVTCFVESHKAHDFADVKEIPDVLSDRQKIFELWKITEDVLRRFEKEKNNVIKHLAGVEEEINTTADTLIAVIQRDTEKLVRS